MGLIRWMSMTVGQVDRQKEVQSGTVLFEKGSAGRNLRGTKDNKLCPQAPPITLAA